MNKSDTIGVITVTYNSEAVIGDFMDSVLSQTGAAFKLYVVDNASSDETVARVSGCVDSRILVIRNASNVGVAQANNLGIRAACRDLCGLILLLNNDTAFGPNLFAVLREGLQQSDSDMVVPKILFFENPTQIWCAGGYLTGWRASARHFGLGQRDDGRFDEPRQVTYSPTCCMLIKSSVFERIGMMDPKYFVYFDDTDFCLRAHRAQIRLLYWPPGRLLHKVGSLTGGNESDFSVRYGVRNRVYYTLKNFSRWRSVFYLPAYHTYVTLKYLFRRPYLRSFVIAQKAFWEGLALFRSSRNETTDFVATTDVD